MAKVRYFKVVVTLNELAKHTKTVPEWEIGVLQAQWGDNAQVVEDDTSPFTVDRELPDPRDEFERLAQLYGPRHGDLPFVAAVYGNFGPGVNALRDSIARAAGAIPKIPVVPVENPVPDAGSEDGSSEISNEGGDPEISNVDLTDDSEDFADLAE